MKQKPLDLLLFFLRFLITEFAPYLALSALLLSLVNSDLSQRGWRIARIIGIIWLVPLLLELAIVVIWDVNRWIGGDVWVFNPTTGVWPLFGEQWIGPLITIALILTLALTFAFLALMRSSLIQPEGEPQPAH